MVDGASLLSQMFWGFLAHKIWVDEPGVNMLDGARAVLRHLHLRGRAARRRWGKDRLLAANIIRHPDEQTHHRLTGRRAGARRHASRAVVGWNVFSDL